MKSLLLTIISLLICEVILYLFGYPVWFVRKTEGISTFYHVGDPDLGWQHRPGKHQLIALGGTQKIVVTIRPDGSRVTSSEEHNPGARIIIQGCSFAEGFGLSDQDTFAWQLQSKHPEYSVENFGVAGYGSTQVLLQTERILMELSKLKPLLFLYLFNEFHEARTSGDPAWLNQLLTKKEEAFHYPYYELDQAGDLILHRVKAQPFPWLGRRSRVAALAIEGYKQLTWLPTLLNRRTVSFRVLEKLALLAKTAGSRSVIVLFSMSAASHKEYLDFMSEKNLSFIDCYIPEQHDPKYLLSDGHPNRDLNKLLTECVDRGLSSFINFEH